MRRLGILLLGCVLGCHRKDGREETALREQFMKDELRERGGEGAWEISLQPGVRIGPEWANTEPMITGGRFAFAHRWMGQFGSVRLLADGTGDMVLHLRGVVPLNTLRGPPVFHVRVSGFHLDTFSAVPDDENVAHDVIIDRATIERFRKGPYLYVDIEAMSPAPGERGYMGFAFALKGISWKPVEPR